MPVMHYSAKDIKQIFGFDYRGFDVNLAKGRWVKEKSPRWTPNGSIGAIEFFILPSGKVSRLRTVSGISFCAKGT